MSGNDNPLSSHINQLPLQFLWHKLLWLRCESCTMDVTMGSHHHQVPLSLLRTRRLLLATTCTPFAALLEPSVYMPPYFWHTPTPFDHSAILHGCHQQQQLLRPQMHSCDGVKRCTGHARSPHSPIDPHRPNSFCHFYTRP